MAVTVLERLEEHWSEEHGLAKWLRTVDHKEIGKHYIETAFVFFIAAGLQALLIRSQLAMPNERLVSPETYNELFTMHGVTMIFFFVTPMMFGFGNFLVPLMIGARDMAFPRLNAFGYWVFAFAGVFLYSSYLIHAAPDDGWFNYVPLSGKLFTPGLNIDYYTIGIAFLGISTTVGAINFLVTIFKLRAPGMTLARIPLYCWGIVATSISVLFALPSLTVGNAMLELDRRGGFHFFTPTGGGDVILWQHLFWIFGHPDVYIIVLPGIGIISSIIPVFARRRMIGYVWLALATMATAVIGFGVWVHHMFATGLPVTTMAFFSAASFIVTIPSGVQIFGWAATVISGRPWPTTAMLFAIGTIITFVMGGVTGVMFAAVPFDQQITDSYFVVAHFHYVLFGGAVFPLMAAFYFWVPKIWGRMMSERLGKTSFWLSMIGFHLTFFPMHIAGLLGMPRRVWTYNNGLGWNLWNLLSTIGAFLTAAGILLTAVNLVTTLRRGKAAGRNPWNAPDLEWGTSSPPPAYNFAQIPVVRSREPLWDQPELRELDERVDDPAWTLAEGHDTVGTSVVDAEPESILAMPEDTYVPALMAFGIGVIAVGILGLIYPVIGLGIVITVGSMLAWFRPKEAV